MNVSVIRHSFFSGPRGTLRFTERSPSQENDGDHQVCNCTQHVTTQPTGTPHYINQTIEITVEADPYSVQLRLSQEHAYFTIWGPKTGARHDRSQEHAYFWFTPRYLRVEVTGTGDHDDLDVTFGNVYWGNQIDTSRMMNGHSPSRIVDTRQIGADQIWAHDCCFGDEAIEFFQDGNDFWWNIRNQVDDLVRMAKRQNVLDGDVDLIRSNVESDRPIQTVFGSLVAKLLDTVKHMKDTELYQVCYKVDRFRIKDPSKSEAVL